jgi:hypothetical protein
MSGSQTAVDPDPIGRATIEEAGGRKNAESGRPGRTHDAFGGDLFPPDFGELRSRGTEAL